MAQVSGGKDGAARPPWIPRNRRHAARGGAWTRSAATYEAAAQSLPPTVGTRPGDSRSPGGSARQWFRMQIPRFCIYLVQYMRVKAYMWVFSVSEHAARIAAGRKPASKSRFNSARDTSPAKSANACGNLPDKTSLIIERFSSPSGRVCALALCTGVASGPYRCPLLWCRLKVSWYAARAFTI